MTNASDHATGVANGARLSSLKVAELQELASSLGIPGGSKLRKGELVEAISARQAADAGSSLTLDVDVTDARVPATDEAVETEPVAPQAPVATETLAPETAPAVAVDAAPEAADAETVAVGRDLPLIGGVVVPKK